MPVCVQVNGKPGQPASRSARQEEILRYFARLKSSEACRRNTDKALHVLAGGKGRFMARSWSGGR